MIDFGAVGQSFDLLFSNFGPADINGYGHFPANDHVHGLYSSHVVPYRYFYWRLIWCRYPSHSDEYSGYLFGNRYRV